ncbi:MAG: acetate--CoA ligase family protein [Pseudomonadales bacterium]|nr:acetate--CoA ligase family protein [Pseudomonadales bacterium]
MIKKIFERYFLGKNQPDQEKIWDFRSSLGSMFYPKSIALIGASNDEKKLGAIVLKNIIQSGFVGEIFPLNLKSPSILGLTAYKQYQDLPVVPDLALIAIPAKFVSVAVDEIAKKGTKNIVIFSAGFKEIGNEGLALENELKDLIKKYKINVLGPNCLGFVNNLAPVNVTFGQPVKNKGNLRFLSQSGAIASSIFDWADSNGIGFGEFVTLGNKTDLNENDILNYFAKNDISQLTKENGSSDVVPIGMYLESIVDGQEFIRIAKTISQKNPIFVLKPGKSTESKQAMQSHTGAIAGEDYVFDVALEKAGVLRCEGIEDFFDLSRTFAWEKVPKGKNIAIISNAGGPAVISSDYVSEAGLNLVRFDEETRRELEIHLPRAASILNPVDVLGDALAERYESAIKTLIVDEDVHSLLIILTPQIMTQIEETAGVIGKLSLEYGKPIFCSFMGGSLISKGEKILNKFKIPSFRYPQRAIRVVAQMCKWKEYQDLQKSMVDLINDSESTSESEMALPNIESSSKLLSTVLAQGRKNFDSFEANQLLNFFGINTPQTKKCESLQTAKDFVSENNFPVVLKISSSELLHKSDSGGVIVDIESDERLNQAYESLNKIIKTFENTSSYSIQIQKQVNKGIELIIGSKKDPTFGNVLMFGAGGLLANLIEDRNLGLVPLDRYEIEKMVQGSKVYQLIKGYRGDEGYKIDKIIDLIFKVQNIVDAHDQIVELDINPVILNREGIWSVDGKIVLG